MTPSEYYQQALEAGYRCDTAQQQAIIHTQDLYRRLIARPAHPTLRQRLLRNRAPVTGLYLHGGTGRGKTWLVDSFYSCLPFNEKHRSHFHAFMRDVHARLQHLPKTPDPLKVIATELAGNMRLLCLDEFHVHDIGDAMIMAGLLHAIFERGITLVATSNIAIADLYQYGLQRDRFMPTIALLQQHTTEVDLGQGTDYRMLQIERKGTYFIGNAEQGNFFLQQYFSALAPCAAKHNRQLVINKRTIDYVAMADDIIWFEFDSICNTPRADSDYISIASTCHTIMIANVPYMGEEHDDIAKRFIHLIDTIYDYQTKCIVTAADEPGKLYHGRALTRAFARTVSRLMEMDSDKYLSLPHRLNIA